MLHAYRHMLDSQWKSFSMSFVSSNLDASATTELHTEELYGHCSTLISKFQATIWLLDGKSTWSSLVLRMSDWERGLTGALS